MFKDAFVFPKAKETPVAPAKPQQFVPEDPEIAKLRALVLKWLTIVIAGGALALIVWRIILKFI